MIVPDPENPQPLVPAEDLLAQVRVEMPIDIPQDLSLPIGDVFAPPNSSTSAGPGSGGGIGTGRGSGVGEGTGMGLAMVKRILEIHNAEIKVKSKAGEGSCFSVFIPAAD